MLVQTAYSDAAGAEEAAEVVLIIQPVAVTVGFLAEAEVARSPPAAVEEEEAPSDHRPLPGRDRIHFFVHELPPPMPHHRLRSYMAHDADPLAFCQGLHIPHGPHAYRKSHPVHSRLAQTAYRRS